MPTIVQTFQGRVTGLWGHASIRGADGKMHPLKLGDVIHQGDVILTTQDGIVRLSPEGSDIELAGDPAGGTKKPAVDEIDRVISALNNADPQAATAAGVAGGDGGGDLTPGLRVERVNEGLTPFALLQGGGLDESSRSARDPAAASDAAATNTQVPAQPPANNSPIAVADSAATAINTPLTVAVLANDSDRDGNALTLTGATLANPAQGSVVANPDGTLTFTPATNVSGPITITYTVSDGQGGSASATVTVTVGANTPPSGADAARSLAEDGGYTVATADFGYTDPDAGQTLAAVRIDSIPAAGSLLLDGVAVTAGTVVSAADIAAGHLTFVPAANANGAPYASFGFSVQDSAGAFDPAPNTVNFSVTPVNDAPIAHNDLASTPINTPATIAVLGNDSDVDGDTLTVTGATLNNPALGSVTVNPDGTLGFTPASNVSGSVVINYSVADPSGASSTATVTVNVGSNNPPTGADATVTLAEDTTRSFAPADFGFSDADAGQTFANVRIDTLPAAGMLTFNGAAVVAGQVIAASDLAQLVFTPAPNANGSAYAGFAFSVQDSAGAFDPAPNTITFNVTPVNDGPVANADVATASEDTPLAGNVLSNDTDVDGNALTVTQFSIAGATYAAGTTATLAGIGTLTIDANGGYSFAPAANYHGPVPQASYTVSDGSATASSTLDLVVTSVNDAPVAQNDLASTPINAALTNIAVLANDSDVDGDTLTVSAATLANPALGSVAINPDGTLNFTPASNVSGPVVINYTIADPSGATSTATLTVNVGNNTPPAGADATVTLAEDASKTFAAADFGFSDADAGQTFANIRIDTLPSAGTLTFNGTAVVAGQVIAAADAGLLVFTPIANANGNSYASFAFSVQDSAGAFDPAPNTITFDVTPVNDAPVANVDTAAATEDTPLAGNVLTNDTDIDGDTLTVTQFSVGGTSYAAGSTATLTGVGTLQLNADGSYAFTPVANYHGPVPQASYTISDGSTTASATLSLSVTPVNDAPIAQNDVASTPINTALANIDVLGNDSDVDVDTLTVSAAALANPALGSVSINPDGTLNFTPASNVSGPIAINYTISDGQGATSSAVLTVNVGANTPPAGTDALVTIAEDTSKTFSAADFGYTDSDAGQAFGNVRIDTLPVAGTLALNGSAVTAGQVIAVGDLAQLVFTPAADANGNGYASFTFSVQDSAGAFDAAPNTITIDVTPVTDGFTDADEAVSVNEDSVLAGSVLSGTSSVDGPVAVTQFVIGAATYAAGATASIAGVGSLTIAANGTYTFTPAANYTGPVPVATYTLSDGTSTDTSTLTISVTPMADPAVISGVANGATVEDTTLVASGKLDVADPDAGQSAFQPQTNFAGAHGTFSIDTTGNWTYTLNNADPAVQALGQGQTLPSEVFTVRSVDGTTANVTVTITGTDDAPVISTGTGAVAENTAPTATGTLTATDVDNPTLAFVPATITGSYGALTLLANGQWTYTLDARAEPLAQNQVVSEPITVQLTDGSTTTVTITVTGTNDAAVITGTTAGAVTEDATLLASGSLAATDIDSPATFTPQTVSLTYGNFTIDAAGSWTYTLRNADANVQALTSSQHPTETVTVTTADGTTQQITITVNGANEAPTAIVTPATGAEDTVGIPVTLTGGDVDGSIASFTVTVLPQNGTLFYAGSPVTAGMVIPASANSASLSFVPNANWNGSTSLSFTTTDDLGAVSSPAAEAINVIPVNDAPTITVPIVAPGLEDTVQSVSGVSVGDIDGDSLVTTLFVSNGTLTLTPSAGAMILGNGGASVILIGSSAAINTALASISYTPRADYNGNDTLQISTGDGVAPVVTASVPLTIAPVADIVSDLISTAEDTAVQIDVLANDSFESAGRTISAIDGTSITASGPAVAVAHGSVTLNAAGQLLFTPTSNYNGTTSFTYTVSSAGTTETASISVNVTPVNDAPLAQNDATATPINTALSSIDVLGNDSDIDGDTLTVSGATLANPALGSVSINPDGTLNFTPASNVSGPVAINYTISDGQGGTASAVLTVNVGANTPPAGVDATVTIAEDTSKTFSATDFVYIDADAGQTFANVRIDTLPAAGTLTLNGSAVAAGQIIAASDIAQLVFTPAANANGSGYASFTFSVQDSAGAFDAASNTITIDVTPVADPAVISGVANGATVEDTTLVAGGKLDVADPDVGEAAFQPQTNLAGAHGTFSIDAAGNWTYTLNNADPAVQALGQGQTLPNEVFTVHSIDGTAATVSVTITGTNDAAVITGTTTGAVTEDATLVASGSLAATDVDSPAAFTPQTVSLTYGNFTIDAAGSWTYTLRNADANVQALTSNQHPTETTTVTTADGTTQQITITVNGANEAPTAIVTPATGAEDAAGIPVTLAGSDVDGSIASFTVTVLPQNGTLFYAGNPVTAGMVIPTSANSASLSFVPNANWNGSTSLSFSSTDNEGAGSAVVAQAITVTAVNDTPIGVADTASAVEAGGIGNGTLGTNPSGNVLTNDTDPDTGDTKSVSTVSGAATGTVGGATAGSYGTLVLNADGSYGYTVDNGNAAVQALRTAGDALTDTFTYTVRDAAGATSSTTLTVTITGANDAPVATADVGSVNEGATRNATAALGVLANDSDVDAGDTKTVSAVAFGATTGTVGSTLTGTYGTLTLNADGSYSYQATQPAATALAQGQIASESFSYTMVDAAGAASTSTLTFTVTGVNNAPVAASDTNTVSEDTPLVVAASPTTGLLANDSDPDAGASLGITQFSIAGDPATYAAGTAATITGVGTLTINANGSYSFVPAANYDGAVPLATYTVSDGITTAQSTLTLTVTPVNDAPVLSLDFDHSHNTVAVQAISGLFNTGQSNAGAALAAGTPDPHYTLVSAPAGSTLTTAAASGLVGAWVANDADSMWIGSTGNHLTGIYQYQTSFTLQTGADPRSVHIAFDLASDNNLRDILVNGVSTGFTSDLQYAAFTHVELDGGSAAFGAGINTITFVVDNRDPNSPTASGPTGLRIDNITGSVAVVTPDAVMHQGDYAAIYVEGTPVPIGDNDVRIQDVDNTALQGATITLTNPQAGDVLQLSALPAGITASVNAAGTLVTLSGSGTLAAYEAAIRAVQFNNTSESPSGAVDRLVTVVVSDGSANSNIATTTIHVVPANDSPMLDLDANNSTTTGTGFVATFVENSSTRIVDTDLAIQDVDSTTLHSATIHITNLQLGDVLTAGVLPSGIKAAVYDPAAGVLTLSGTATLADYRNALAGIVFSNASDNPSAVARTIEISVNDGSANSNVAISTINVVPVNDAPVANADTGSGAEDAVLTGNVLTNDSDVDSASLSVTQFSIGASTYAAGTTATIAGVGTLVIAANGAYTFTPVADWNGSVPTVNYTTSDGALTASATLTLNVTAVADVINDAVTTNEDTAIVFNPITGSNETSGTDNFESAGRTLTAVGAPLHGTVTFTAAGNITYTPAANYNGPDSFTYTVTSGGVTETATINVNVAAVNDAPVNTIGALTTNEDTPLKLSGLSIADPDGSSGATTVTLAVGSGTIAAVSGAGVTVSGSGTGTLTLSGTLASINSYLAAAASQPTYTPPANANGSVTLTMTTSDGALTDVDSVAITINPVNDAPLAQNDSASVLASGTVAQTAANGIILSGAVAAGRDSDIDGDALTVANAIAGSGTPTTAITVAGTTLVGTYGDLLLRSDGSYSYTASRAGAVATGATVNDVFTYQVSDGHGGTANATLTVQVGGQADTLTASAPTTGALVSSLGLRADYYGYNETDPSGQNTNRRHSDDGTLGNLDSIADITTIVNGRNAAVGASGSVIGTSTASANNAADAHFTARTIDYGNNPAVTAGLGTSSVNIASGGSTAGLTDSNNELYHFLHRATSGDQGSLVVTDGTGDNNNKGAGPTIGLGNTTDAAIRMTGEVYFDAGVYDIRVTADDGFRLNLDGQTVALFDGNQSPTSRTFTGIPIEGGMTPLELIYWEQGGNARLTIEYKLSSASTYQTLSTDNLPMFAEGSQPTLTETQQIIPGATTGSYLIQDGSTINGGTGNDTITGNSGNDKLSGGADNDVLVGGAGHDVLIGGAGNDTLTGGAGHDVFRWELADRGTAGTPARDVIADFDNANYSGDVLDLRDILVGESHAANTISIGAGNAISVTANNGTLGNYLHFSVVGGNTVVEISSTGGFSGGYQASAVDQVITVNNVNLMAGFSNDSQVINDLLKRGKLVTD